jgi:hypothetical protein
LSVPRGTFGKFSSDKRRPSFLSLLRQVTGQDGVFVPMTFTCYCPQTTPVKRRVRVSLSKSAFRTNSRHCKDKSRDGHVCSDVISSDPIGCFKEGISK